MDKIRQISTNILMAFAVMTFFTSGSAAAVFKCAAANGSISYQASPCPVNNSQKKMRLRSAPGSAIRDQNDDALDTGIQATKIVLYGASWCKHCKQVRQLFKENHIPFTEHDIDKSITARNEYEALGIAGIPVTTVGDYTVRGFNRQRLLDLTLPLAVPLTSIDSDNYSENLAYSGITRRPAKTLNVSSA